MYKTILSFSLIAASITLLSGVGVLNRNLCRYWGGEILLPIKIIADCVMSKSQKSDSIINRGTTAQII